MSDSEARSVKRYLVGVAVCVTTSVVIQTGSLLYWAGVVDATLESHGRRISAMEVER